MLSYIVVLLYDIYSYMEYASSYTIIQLTISIFLMKVFTTYNDK